MVSNCGFGKLTDGNPQKQYFEHGKTWKITDLLHFIPEHKLGSL